MKVSVQILFNVRIPTLYQRLINYQNNDNPTKNKKKTKKTTTYKIMFDASIHLRSIHQNNLTKFDAAR